MRYVIIGAGAVGATMGGRLAQSGREVVLVARGGHYEALRDRGLRLTTPDGEHVHRLPVVQAPAELGELRPDDVLVLGVKTQDCVAALDTWSVVPVAGGGTAGERLPLLCAQNGVESERLALRRFRYVVGVCVWLPATHLAPGEVSAVCAPYSGMLHLGRYPVGAADMSGVLRSIASDLEGSHFLAPVVDDVMRWKYGKLLANVGNAVEAVTGPMEPGNPLLDLAKEEAVRVYAAAGIDAVGETEQKEARADHLVPRELPGLPRGGGSSWQSLTRGTGTIEADYLNGEIVLLGRLHGVPVPANETLQRLADEFARDRRAPGSLDAGDVLALVEKATTA
ncbi:ketopantoate reductase family protein [Streptomyces tsukubensis]|uniref:2-dehydropantoate 2-reductase n=1 Tax=Streptomyces tsukubensis TaxID=83656 RepID=A0A1V4AAN6_9ACTN|nr:2-dehydropantoate 2-reductase N-terminal domain-containing protein [Streptomyces tsukubensis]OON80710.1 2-dehydropantoate 2-reductase [Streptomyces tsukubensis]QFR96273.1 ketopantoate reductase family protein [Streptomyces tsukubensis]